MNQRPVAVWGKESGVREMAWAWMGTAVEARTRRRDETQWKRIGRARQARRVVDECLPNQEKLDRTVMERYSFGQFEGEVHVGLYKNVTNAGEIRRRIGEGTGGRRIGYIDASLVGVICLR